MGDIKLLFFQFIIDLLQLKMISERADHPSLVPFMSRPTQLVSRKPVLQISSMPHNRRDFSRSHIVAEMANGVNCEIATFEKIEFESLGV